MERRHVFATMGTMASLSIRAAEVADLDLAHLELVFQHFDETFSLYKPDSQLSQIARGDLKLIDASEELRETYALGLEWRAQTNGDFTPHRPDGIIDLSGLVKALAMTRAGDDLVGSGLVDWCLNVGGDVLTSGTMDDGGAWSVGIVDPLDRDSLLTSITLAGTRRACATSGSAERGDHIWASGGAPPTFVQATVVADDIVTADVLATAIIAGGPVALDRICSTWDIDAMTTDLNGNIRMTLNFTPRMPSNR